MKKRMLFSIIALGFTLANGDALLLNEYNAVAPDNQLKNDGYDTHFGDIDGNGGSWLELVVNEDYLDIRGATLNIERSGGVHVLTANFPNLLEFAYLRKGTIITVSNEPTDLSYAPLDSNNPDWTINLNANDLVNRDGVFETSDRTLDVSIISVDETPLMRSSGEVVKGWGIDDEEVFKLKKEPSAIVEPTDTAYGDDYSGKQIISTFGSPNRWIETDDSTSLQTFSDLRNITVEGSVNQMLFLKNYTTTNNELELVSLKDKVDLRNSILKITDENSTYIGKLPNIDMLSQVRSGTILTISDNPTDLSYNPFDVCNADWTLNINKNDLTSIEGSFFVNSDNLSVSMVSGIGDITIMPENQTIYTTGFTTQELNGLRVVALNENFRRAKSSLLLNEYNGVASDEFLKDNGYDVYLGTTQGNGGAWLELVVTRDYLNLQNAKLNIKENCIESFSGNFPSLLELAYLRKGTVITVSNQPTDMSYSPFAPHAPDWKLNINIDDFVNKSGNFNTSSQDLVVAISDESGEKVLLSQSGEGVWGKHLIDNQEVYKLKAEPNKDVSPYSGNYGDDGDSKVLSTFFNANRWYNNSDCMKYQQFTIREDLNLSEVGGIVLSNISGLEELRDAESLQYVPVNNSLWITDDDSHHVYEMDLTTHQIKSVFNDEDLGGFTNGAIQDHCEDHLGACDIESVAYNENSDTLYIFTGKSPGDPVIFKLTRPDTNSSFTLSDYKKLGDIEYPATTFINGDFIVANLYSLYSYNFDLNETSTTPLYTTPAGKIVGLAYDKSSSTLWVTTSNFELLKVDWTTKETKAVYAMRDNGVYDPRGIDIIDGKLYILEGINHEAKADEAVAPIGHPLKNAIHIYDLP